VKLLLDTHAWIWMLASPERLCEEAQTALANSDNEVFLSVASAWEAGIKHTLGKLSLPAPLPSLAELSVQKFNIQVLPIALNHALTAATLPPHHRDPFDRMLVAQRDVEGLILVTADEAIRRYDGACLWAR
jgi:PIN domain nuclease of toxin-antitoxin system